jgi:hypothetical protein
MDVKAIIVVQLPWWCRYHIIHIYRYMMACPTIPCPPIRCLNLAFFKSSHWITYFTCNLSSSIYVLRWAHFHRSQLCILCTYFLQYISPHLPAKCKMPNLTISDTAIVAIFVSCILFEIFRWYKSVLPLGMEYIIRIQVNELKLLLPSNLISWALRCLDMQQ